MKPCTIQIHNKRGLATDKNILDLQIAVDYTSVMHFFNKFPTSVQFRPASFLVFPVQAQPSIQINPQKFFSCKEPGIKEPTTGPRDAEQIGHRQSKFLESIV